MKNNKKYNVKLNIIKSEEEVLYLDELGVFSEEEYMADFTLGEIEAMSYGKLAQDVGMLDTTEIVYVGDIVGSYWINPLIELIEVNKGESDGTETIIERIY